jgi:hypothetical protein
MPSDATLKKVSNRRLKVNCDASPVGQTRVDAALAERGAHDRAKFHQDLWLSGSAIDLNGRGFVFPCYLLGLKGRLPLLFACTGAGAIFVRPNARSTN